MGRWDEFSIFPSSKPCRGDNSRKCTGLTLNIYQTELVLAVGGFDHTYGAVRIVTYDKPADNGPDLLGRAWE